MECKCCGVKRQFFGKSQKYRRAKCWDAGCCHRCYSQKGVIKDDRTNIFTTLTFDMPREKMTEPNQANLLKATGSNLEKLIKRKLSEL